MARQGQLRLRPATADDVAQVRRELGRVQGVAPGSVPEDDLADFLIQRGINPYGGEAAVAEPPAFERTLGGAPGQMRQLPPAAQGALQERWQRAGAVYGPPGQAGQRP